MAASRYAGQKCRQLLWRAEINKNVKPTKRWNGGLWSSCRRSENRNGSRQMNCVKPERSPAANWRLYHELLQWRQSLAVR